MSQDTSASGGSAPAPSTAGQNVALILRGQRFPAARWELIVAAYAYGADAASVARLRELPDARYASLGDVVQALDLRHP